MNFVWALALLVISYAITALTAKKPENAKPAQINEFQFPQHNEGTSEAVVFGEVWSADWMVLYYGNLRNEPIRAKGGKK